MNIEIEPVDRRQDMRRFLRLPQQLHRNHEGWVPALRMDEQRMFDRKRNLALRYCDCALWLARANGRTVGRIGGIINHRYNEIRREHTARFTHLDCIDDLEVANALLSKVKDWAHAAGMDRVIGPMGFTDQDPEGFVVDGFQEEPSIATYHNREYIVRFLDQLGWTKHVDYVVYKVPVVGTMPRFYERIADRVARQGLLRLVEFRHRSELKPLIRPIFRLMNDAFTEIEGYAPLDEMEMEDLARRYLPVIDPRFVKVVTAHDEVIGFIIAMPNIVDGIRRARGRLLPFGWIWVLQAGRRAVRLDLLLGGIEPEYRGKGIDVLLGRAMMRSAHQAGFQYLDSHHELEDNTRIRAEMERMGGTVYKRYRIFEMPVPGTLSDAAAQDRLPHV
jgi:GNAT superfamily N-acetyltransferase